MAAVRRLESILGTGSSLGIAGGGSTRISRRGEPLAFLAATATCEARTAPNEAPMRSKGPLPNTEIRLVA
eukprot:3829143-Prymnesium_polylepis.1